jgi:hypothetical protein
LYGVLMLTPALQQSVIAGAKTVARQRCLSAVVAVQRHRLRHGQPPESLNAVDSALLGPASEPPDPFDGQPLRYKIEESRVLVYSVGPDGKDDGGNVDGSTPPQPRDVGYALPR